MPAVGGYRTMRRALVYLGLICLSELIRSTSARPPWLAPNSSVYNQSANCNTDDELLDLCQRCAKLTKSQLAYPTCCSSDMDARRWCTDYVYFGRAQHDFY